MREPAKTPAFVESVWHSATPVFRGRAPTVLAIRHCGSTVVGSDVRLSSTEP